MLPHSLKTRLVLGKKSFVLAPNCTLASRILVGVTPRECSSNKHYLQHRQLITSQAMEAFSLSTSYTLTFKIFRVLAWVFFVLKGK